MLPKALPLEADAASASTMQGQARSLAGRNLLSGSVRTLRVRACIIGLLGRARLALCKILGACQLWWVANCLLK